MAKRIEADKFLVIECTAQELMDAVGSDICICDWCGRRCHSSDKGCYVAVLNQWFCEDCFRRWLATAEWFAEDVDVKRRNFEFYAPRLGVKCH